MEMIGRAYSGLLTGAVLILAVLVILSMIRSVKGPGITDRLVAVNMAGTMVISMIAILSVYLDEGYLADICLIYAMISFLGVVVLSRVYTGVYLRRKKRRADMQAVTENVGSQAATAESVCRQRQDIAAACQEQAFQPETEEEA